MKIDLPDEKASQQVAARLAACLSAPMIVTFSGDIGVGKTTFIRAMLYSLGVKSVIKSPTFSIVESYQGTHLQINHFDLYRIRDEIELDEIGFREYFSNTALCCIEWPEQAPTYLAKVDVGIKLSIKGEGRSMYMEAFSALGREALSCLAGG
jgi:tRNA threonylcarbamoyladenosine biosynthesis protein TsaE